MKITVLQVPPIGTNCYLLKDEETGLGAILDPGGDAASIRTAVDELALKPAAILLTHGHYDHTGAVLALKETWPQLPVYLHPQDALQMKDRFSQMPDIGATVPYDEGDTVSIGNLTVRVLHTPGHTKGSVVLAVGEALFTGDTLFRGSCGRTDLPSGNYEEMMASLRRLAKLEGDYQVLPGHEGRSTLSMERQSNFYLLQAMGQ